MVQLGTAGPQERYSMRLRDIVKVVQMAVQDFGKDHAGTLSAARAYFTLFSIGPLLIVLIAIVGAVLGEQAARGQLMDTIKGYMGEDGARTIQAIVQSASQPQANLIASIIGIIGVVFGAMAIFGELKNSLNRIWDVPSKQGLGLMDLVFTNMLTFLMVVSAGGVLFLSLIANTVLSAVAPFVVGYVPAGAFIWQLVNYGVTLGIVTLTFAIIFKVLPDVTIAWKDVWLGAFITALLFMVGQIGIGLYIALMNVRSAFGAASSLVVILVWIFLSAVIIFFGAEVTQVYANNYGSHPKVRQLSFRIPRLRRRMNVDDLGVKKIEPDAGEAASEPTVGPPSP